MERFKEHCVANVGQIKTLQTRDTNEAKRRERGIGFSFTPYQTLTSKGRKTHTNLVWMDDHRDFDGAEAPRVLKTSQSVLAFLSRWNRKSGAKNDRNERKGCT